LSDSSRGSTTYNIYIKIPEDGAEAPKHVGAFICLCAFVGTNK